MFFLNIMPSGNMYVSRFSKNFAQRLQKTQKKIWPLCSTKTIFIIIAFVCEWVGAVVCDMVMKSWTITLKIGTAKLVSREQFCLPHSNAVVWLNCMGKICWASWTSSLNLESILLSKFHIFIYINLDKAKIIQDLDFTDPQSFVAQTSLYGKFWTLDFCHVHLLFSWNVW